jgi:hypothetical protein
MVPNIDPEFVIRAFHWYKTVLDKNEAYGSGTFLLLEMMQKVSTLDFYFFGSQTHRLGCLGSFGVKCFP